MPSIGTDIEQISRFAAIMARTPRFTARLFTARERAYCEQRACPAQHYAARFCAKEAFAKALGCALAWQEVEVAREASGPPTLITHGEAARRLQGRAVQLTLAHAGDYAVAFVLIED